MRLACSILSAVCFAFAAAAPVAAQQTFLEATFNDKTIDATIGMGGAAAGEPAWFDANLRAVVRATPFPTPCLELEGGDLPNSYLAGFELLGSVDVSTGTFAVLMDLWFEQFAVDRQFAIKLTSRNFSPLFMEIGFESAGEVRVWTPDSSPGVVATCPVGRAVRLVIVVDQDTRTYSVWFDGIQVVADQSHGVSTGGIGLISLMCRIGNTTGAKFWIDQIWAGDSMPQVPVKRTTWGRIRAQYRD